MKVLAIAEVSLRRLFRDRTNIFFVVIAPLLFILVLGLLFGGGQPTRLAVSYDNGPLAQRLVDALAEPERVELVRSGDPDRLRIEVERGTVNGGLLIPAGYDQQIAAGEPVAVRYLSRPDDPAGADLGVLVRSAVGQQAALLRAARVGADARGTDLATGLRAAEAATVPGVEVVFTSTGGSELPAGFNQFAPIAPSMLLLYVFLTSLTGSLGLIESRRLGVTTRVYATPTRASTIVAGEALGRFGIALAQGLVVIVGSALLFGVGWGDPLGAAAVLLLFCLVGSGAAMLLGSLFRAEGPALGAALALGLGLAALGGTMLPLELMAEPVQRIARFTPHAWGYEAFAELVRHGGSIVNIAPHLAVLAGFGIGLCGIGVWRLRRAITG